MKVDYHVFKSILNGYLGLHMDRAQRPTFFEIAETCPALDAVTEAYPAIRKEFDQLLAEGLTFPQYHEVDSGERAISNTTPKRWNVFVLECLGYKVELNRQRCPETCRALACAQYDPGVLLHSGSRQIRAGA
jgi:aspartate beta-hydroxylase